MANADHLKILKKGVVFWNELRKTSTETSSLLSGADLSEAHLSGANLAELNLSDANLSRANLIDTNLSGANLSVADLNHANLTRADLTKADLTGATIMDAKLVKARLCGANLDSSDLRRSNLRKAHLRNANLFEADLIETDLRNADLRNADLSRADLSRANLGGANLGGANLSGANLSEANLSGTIIGKSIITSEDPSGVDLENTKSSSLREKLEVLIREGKVQERALERLRRIIDSRMVEHRSWGKGTIQDIDSEACRLVVDFYTKADHSIDLNFAASILSPSKEELSKIHNSQSPNQSNATLPMEKELHENNPSRETFSRKEIQRKGEDDDSETKVSEMNVLSHKTTQRDDGLFIGSTSAGLERLRNRLLDLTNRNRLLNFRHPKTSSLRFIDELPDQLFGLLIGEKELKILPIPEPANAEDNPNKTKWAEQLGFDPNYDLPEPLKKQVDLKHSDDQLQTLLYAKELDSRLARLRSAAKLAINETGTNMLYLAFGFLEWFERKDSETPHHAPLILLPMMLSKGSVDQKTSYPVYKLGYSGEDIIPNLSLFEKLQHDFGIQLPVLEEQELPESYFSRVCHCISAFREWRVRRFVTLSMFQFGKLLMFLDLNPKGWPSDKSINGHPIVGQFFEGSSRSEFIHAPEYDIDKHEYLGEEVPLIFDADASQHNAIIDVLHGKNLVIEGPPGTGKSQTITNLITSAMYHGKSVLFVSEKLAALEVVRRRLDHSGLGQFCLELHSHKTQKRALLDDLDARIQSRYRHEDPSDLSRKLKMMQDYRSQLTEYAHLLNRKFGKLDLSFHDLLWSATRYQTELQIPESRLLDVIVSSPEEMEWRQLRDCERVLDSFSEAWVLVSSGYSNLREHPWHGVLNADLSQHNSGLILGGFQVCLERVDELFRNWDNFEKLSGVEIPPTMNNASFLGKCFEKYPTVSDNTFFPLMHVLSEPATQKKLNEFFEEVDRVNELKPLVESCFSNPLNIPTDDIQCLEKGLLQLRELITVDLPFTELKKLRELLILARKDLESVAEKFPMIGDIFDQRIAPTLGGLLSVRDAVLLAQEAPSSEKPIRKKELLCDDNLSILKKAAQEAVFIVNAEKSLKEFFDLRTLESTDSLIQHIHELRNTSWYSFVSPKWNAANRYYRSIACEIKKISASVKASQLSDLLEFCKNSKMFQERLDLDGLLGEHFDGIKTDFDLVLRVATWGQELQIRLGEIDDGKSLSRFLYEASVRRLHMLARIPESDISFWAESQHFLECWNCLTPIVSFSNSPDQPLTALLDKMEKLTVVLDEFFILTDKWVKGDNYRISTLNEALEQIASYRVIWHRTNSNEEICELLGAHFKGLESDRDAIDATVSLVNGLDVLKECPSLWEWVMASTDKFRVDALYKALALVTNSVEELEKERNQIRDQTDLCESAWIDGNPGDYMHYRKRLSESLKEDDRKLRDWLDYIGSQKKVQELNLSSLAELVMSQEISPDHLVSTFRFCVFRDIVQHLIQVHELLRRFRGRDHERIGQDFRKIDREIIVTRRKSVAFRIDDRNVPMGNGTGPVSTYSELSLISREIEKKTRHIPIRQLTHRAGAALQGLKPCFMMGPLSVAQYLPPGKIEFDLIVMDEASQLKPEDALGAIARGGQLVVVGDSHQLPPTNFFDRIFPDEEELHEHEATGLDEAESILEIASWLFQPTRRLLWHYRSRHESLIAFSNRQFYDESLIVFPSPREPGRDLGLHFVFVPNGVFASRINKHEAEAVVEELTRHIREFPEDTVGIVTMNSQQCELIEALVEERSRREPDVARYIEQRENQPEPFFVKNLENVQGDERDSIILSITYGPNPTGHVFQRFGPINQKNGWRRLNVLVTRSRKRISVVSSMRSGDIPIGVGSPRGVVALHDYLDYAENKTDHSPEISDREPDSDFEVTVANLLKQHGLQCVPQLGVAGYFIDIAIRNPDRPGDFILAVECDGATYHSAKSARDRDRLRQEILEGLGWEIHRIWSTDWFNNPHAQVERVLEVVQMLRQEGQKGLFNPNEKKC